MQRQITMIDANEKLELFISCRSLADVDTFSVSDPFVILLVRKGSNYIEFGRTELIWNNLNPNFANSFQVDYYFEVQQYVKFEVHHYISQTQSQIIGTFESTISAIAGSKDQVLLGDLVNQTQKHTGKIIIRADQVKSCNDDLVLKLSAIDVENTRYLFFHATNPFLRIYRTRQNDVQPVLVYETEHIQNCLKPKWKPIAVRAQKICNGDYFMPLKIELWDYHPNGSHIYLGETKFTIDEINQQQNSQRRREFKNLKENKPQGTLIFDDFKLLKKYSFLDYISGGTQLNLVLAIDFTASNQNPHHPTSLHYRDPQGGLNQYQQAILGVGEILVNYDYDKKVPVYGFGCKPRLQTFNTNETLHCFPINGNPENPEVDGVNGIMDAYAHVLPDVSFDGPTYFVPILNEMIKIAGQCRDMCGDIYYILLILTDGEIHDMQASMDAIIASSHLPLSIIIIGIGNANFKNMEKLDNDDLSMVDSSGKKSKRDLVQFVPFNEYKNNHELLAKSVLEELPDQLVQYMTLIGKQPSQRDQFNLNNYDFGTQNIQPPNKQQQQQQAITGQQPQQEIYGQQYQFQQAPNRQVNNSFSQRQPEQQVQQMHFANQ